MSATDVIKLVQDKANARCNNKKFMQFNFKIYVYYDLNQNFKCPDRIFPIIEIL